MQVNQQLSFNQICEGSYQKVTQYARSLCRNSSDAEDITQEAFVRAYIFLHTFDHRSSVDAWLLRIARNVFFDSVRKKGRRVKTVSVEADVANLQIKDERDSAKTVETVFADVPEDPNLFEAINRLNEPQRLLLEMIVVEQKTYGEVSEILNLPISVVKSRYLKALKQARSKYRAISTVRQFERANA